MVLSIITATILVAIIVAVVLLAVELKETRKQLKSVEDKVGIQSAMSLLTPLLVMRSGTPNFEMPDISEALKRMKKEEENKDK